MKSGGEKSQGEAKKRRVRRKEKHMREMSGKSRIIAFFQRFVARVAPKEGSLKRQVRSHVAR